MEKKNVSGRLFEIHKRKKPILNKSLGRQQSCGNEN